MITCTKCQDNTILPFGDITCICGNSDLNTMMMSCNNCGFVYVGPEDPAYQYLSEDSGITTFCSQRCMDEYVPEE